MSADQTDTAQINRDALSAWETKAAFWDSLMGDEGNVFHRTLLRPAFERLLNVHPGTKVLDVACGTGLVARQLADLGATVTAFDFSSAMLAQAEARRTENITYLQLDATDEAALLALGENQFEAATCNMGLMDMAAIEPLMNALIRLLKPGSPFVFSVLHPSFNSAGMRMIAEREDVDGQLVERSGVVVHHYLHMEPNWGSGAPNEPAPHLYFHRPLHELLNIAFRSGFVMDGIEEPAYPPETSPTKTLSWSALPQIPPAMVVRLRRL
jgi:2-polyprenyl-3-methyl-5-hydroxy-6-metoxy-1,4-benzoquinol methylase